MIEAPSPRGLCQKRPAILQSAAEIAASLESSHYRFRCVRIYSEANLLVDIDDLLVLCQPGKRKRCLFICSNSQLMDARMEVAHLLHQKGGCWQILDSERAPHHGGNTCRQDSAISWNLTLTNTVAPKSNQKKSRPHPLHCCLVHILGLQVDLKKNNIFSFQPSVPDLKALLHLVGCVDWGPTSDIPPPDRSFSPPTDTQQSFNQRLLTLTHSVKTWLELANCNDMVITMWGGHNVMEMLVGSSWSEGVPQGLCSTGQQTPSSSVQTACRETASLGNAHTQQQTALKNTQHVSFITQHSQNSLCSLGLLTMAEIIWCIPTEQQLSFLADV